MFRLIIYSVIEIILLLLCVPLGFFEIFLSKKNEPGSRERKIIFLHGWCNKNFIYFLLKYRLQKLGYSVIMPDLGWHTNDIAEITLRLKKFVSDNSLRDFILMGHSIGGVIALRYYKEKDSKADKLVALGSPFTGSSWIVPFGIFSQSARQITPGSAFLKSLLSETMGASRENIFCLFTKYDEIVPLESAQLAFAKNIEVNTIGHMSFIYSKSVVECLQKLLSNGSIAHQV